jgi:hypothetical protein
MKRILKVLFPVMLAAVPAFAQNADVRREAIQLMERAAAVSSSPNLPNLERSDTFRVLDTASGAREGSFARVVIQGTGRREETELGDYHVVDVWTHTGLTTNRKTDLVPREIDTLKRITPIYLLHFDDEDVIHSIVDKAGNGEKVRCIEFDTIRGKKTENNEFCINPANGTLVSVKVGEDLIENSEFFPFAGALMPGKIVYSFGGIRKLEISQTMNELNDATDGVLSAAPNSVERRYCKTFRRPIGISTPLPPNGNGGRDSEVVIRGIIEPDGKVHEAVVQSAEREDLGIEALNLVRQWTFTPAMCDGKPNVHETVLILHFHGR